MSINYHVVLRYKTYLKGLVIGYGVSGGNNPDPSIKINNIDLWEGLAFLPLSFIVLFFFIKSPIGKDITIS